MTIGSASQSRSPPDLTAGTIAHPRTSTARRERIARVHAALRNPETHAHGADGPPEMPWYLISFARACSHRSALRFLGRAAWVFGSR